MTNPRQAFLPPIGVSLRVNVGSCFSCCQANTCPPKWLRECVNLPESVFTKPAAAAMSSIYHALPSSSNTSFKSTRSPTLGSALLRGCSALCNCHLITAPKCWTSVHFLNYARLDLIARKYLAYFNCLQRFRKHFEEWLPHYWPLLWSTLLQKEQIDNLQTGNCVERTVSHLFRVSLIHHGFHQIIVLIAIPLFSLYDAPNTLSSDLHAFICYHNYPVTGVIFIM